MPSGGRAAPDMIELQGVTKYYPAPAGRKYVFRDVSLRLPDGVSVGVLGPNGAGKSTLLRLLGGIEAPNRGRIVTDARISWPVGLSGSFQGSLTGRDNVRFVCHLMGLHGAAARERVRWVEEFAEVGEAFDRPTKGYSSGMRSRLAFGLSMAFDFDYYLIDEVMAVGDPAFRRKSHDTFKRRLASAHAILVSHQVADIRALCDVVLLLGPGGRWQLFDDREAGIQAYLALGRPAVPAPAPTRAAEGLTA
ncbi:ABC transporter ATP-binding protein [Aquabacterium sp. J223]|uniref:ABC transporter ATP-binding protein n=1 Tax=Aquabacterium sp. J223 TaxID=2898431 RepID=UPI0021AD55FB|nr:ABC transporter ATP-binding protein [Aquabacterium sp. J223]UUX94121.1 ABC transporter ATP-binding protein [Aquabacterium sp. J223]